MLRGLNTKVSALPVTRASQKVLTSSAGCARRSIFNLDETDEIECIKKDARNAVGRPCQKVVTEY